jgi:hypothetical protein
MATLLTALESKSLEKPEETRLFPKGKLDVVTVGGTTMGRATFEPGWKWSDCVKPIVQTRSCEVAHLAYVISGEMMVVMDDGSRLQIKAGDAVAIPPGHDAWIEGTEPCTVVDFLGFADYAKPAMGEAYARFEKLGRG